MEGVKSLGAKIVTARGLAASQIPSHMDGQKGAERRGTLAPVQHQHNPESLARCSVPEHQLCVKAERRRYGREGGEETWLGNLNGTSLSHCMGVWDMIQSITDTALK